MNIEAGDAMVEWIEETRIRNWSLVMIIYPNSVSLRVEGACCCSFILAIDASWGYSIFIKGLGVDMVAWHIMLPISLGYTWRVTLYIFL